MMWWLLPLGAFFCDSNSEEAKCFGFRFIGYSLSVFSFCVSSGLCNMTSIYGIV